MNVMKWKRKGGQNIVVDVVAQYIQCNRIKGMDNKDAINKIKYRIETASRIAGKGETAKAFEDLEIAIQALENQNRIIRILRDQGLTDNMRIEEITKIVGIYV